MNQITRSKTRKASIPAGLAIGAISAFIILLCSIALLAKMVDNQVLSEENTKYGIMILLLVTSFSAAAISCGKIKRQRVLVCAVSGVIYFLIIVSITIIFFDMKFTGIPETAGLIFCGSAIAILLGFRPEKRKKSPKIRI